MKINFIIAVAGVGIYLAAQTAIASNLNPQPLPPIRLAVVLQNALVPTKHLKNETKQPQQEQLPQHPRH